MSSDSPGIASHNAYRSSENGYATSPYGTVDTYWGYSRGVTKRKGASAVITKFNNIFPQLVALARLFVASRVNMYILRISSQMNM